ncbi:MAG TPA: hypothetical protein VGJ62_07275 [Gemmatimonadaceae bacterium]|jgi:hypothetical protein
MTKSLYVLTLATAMACAAAGTGTTHVRDSRLITEQEITAANESNAYDVVAKLRPNFLKTRGRSTINASASEYASVFLDGQLYGDLSTLHNIAATQIREIRYISGTDAVTRYGMQYGAGVIDVRTR